MQIRMESEEQVVRRNRKGKKKRKRQRPCGPKAPSPKQAAEGVSEDLCRRELEWQERLEADPSSFAEIEREVHACMRSHADVFVAGLLSKASSSAAMQGHVAHSMEQAAGELRAVEKKSDR